MKIGLITIGAELLNGARTDTNAAWIGQHVIPSGGSVEWHMTVSDKKEDIINARYGSEIHPSYFMYGRIRPNPR